ncbi:hypothetical protein [Actinomyces vulturis]|uniref:hypothetical protein n=1 Tax=Actinomyces vulturis TaxID=1857645 RepID=UPI000831667E|nr:hypothetical protein [Actinomyces vulturis]
MKLPEHATLSTALSWMWDKERALNRSFRALCTSHSLTSIVIDDPSFTDAPQEDDNAIVTLCQYALPLPPGLEVREGYLTLAGQRMRQPDETTCGVMCALVGTLNADPQRARGLARLLDAEPDRYAHMVTSFHRHLNRSALGIASWPTQVGTPPWTIAQTMESITGGALSRPIDDRSETWPHLAHLLAQAATSVPLVVGVGGESGSGLSSAVPRHYVMTIPDGWLKPERLDKYTVDGEDETTTTKESAILGCVPTPFNDGASSQCAWVTIYDPSTGRIHRHNLLEQSDLPVAALGNWQRIHWVIYPDPAGK